MQNRVDEVNHIEQLVKDRAGLTFNANRLTSFRETLNEFAKCKNVSVAKLKLELEGNGHWMQELLEQLMIHETYFFREMECLEQVLARLIKDHDGMEQAKPPVRIWSAGCSTGEEAYTISMMLAKSRLQQRYEIIATDFSNRALGVASTAVYSAWSLRTLSDSEKKSMFECNERSYRLKDASIKERVTFLQSNITLKRQLPPEWYQLDLIVCRNVLIYFDRDTVAKTADVFYDSLKEGGLLLVGAADPLFSEHPGFETHNTCHGVIYKKRIKEKTVYHSFESSNRVQLINPPVLKETARSLSSSERHLKGSEKLVEVEQLVASEEAARLYSAGKWSEVIDLVADDRERHLSLLVRSLLNLRRSSEAVAIARAIASENPTNLEALVNLTLALMDMKEHQKALETARQARFLDRSCIYAHFLCGVASFCLSEEEQCLKSMNNALMLLSNLRDQDEIPFLDNEEGKELFAKTVERYIALVQSSLCMVTR